MLKRQPWLVVAILFVTAALGPAVRAADDIGSVRLFVGRSVVVNTDWPIARVSLTSADIADAVVTLPNQVLVQGKVPGTISMFLWDRAGAMRRYEVSVERDLTQLNDRIKELFPGEPISVTSSGKSVVISGTAKTKYIADKAVEVAAGFVEKKEDVVTLLQVREGPPPQVLLRVRFAEVSRTALTELGSSFFTGPQGSGDWLGRSTTGQFPAPDWGETGERLVFSDFLNLFIYNTKHNLGTVIRALQNKGLFQSLAEPNLVAESGKEASFLAGGEFPIPVAQGGSAALSITVMFKEFGVRLSFTPTVVPGDRIRLKVKPEVSTLDFSNAVQLQGFRIPALTTRRTETEIELQNGQTFAIAGLLNNTTTETMQKIPGIGDIPILGLLFRSKAAQKNRSELVVMITPEILQTGSPGVSNEVPRLQEQYLPPIPVEKAKPNPAPAFVAPGWGEAEQGVPPRPKPAGSPSGAAAAPASRPAATPASDRLSPADAAAILSSRDPKAPRFVSPPAPVRATAPDLEAAAATADAAPDSPAAEPTILQPVATPPSAPTPSIPAVGKATEAMSKQEREQQEHAAREQAKRDAKQAEIDRRAEEKERKRDEQLAREQAKRDAEAAKKAEQEAARQAEIEKKRQKTIADAADRVKQAEAAYHVELAKKQ